MSNKKRIARGERVTWRTNVGIDEHSGQVAAFVPAGESIADVMRAAGYGGLGRLAAQAQIRIKESPRDRYLVTNGNKWLCQNATMIERQNPTAKREP